MSKRAAAVAMSHRIGETFDAIVTGAQALTGLLFAL
jgi:hypothetical protein